MNFGLPENLLVKLANIFSLHNSIAEVKVFGSRAKGNHKKGSDIDLWFNWKELKYEVIKRI